MAKVKISELPSLSPATLDTTYVVGISGSTTYKISINQLTSSLDTTFATDLVTAALSSSLNSKLSTSAYSTDSASFNSRIISGSAVAGTISSSAQISALGFLSTSTDLSSLNTISASYLSFTQSYYSASASFDNRIVDLQNATSSYLTSLDGAISSSTQVLNGSGIFSSSTQLPTNLISGSSQISELGFITGSYISSSTYTTDSSSFNSRIISGSAVAGTISSSAQISTLGFVSSSNVLSMQTITSASYAALTPVSGTLYIIIG